MARFVLQPCHLRLDRFVPTDEPPITVDWNQLKERFWLSGNRAGLANLSLLRLGSFVGLTKVSNRVTNFILQNDDRSGSISSILKRDPGFAKRLTEVFRVERADTGSRVVEKK